MGATSGNSGCGILGPDSQLLGHRSRQASSLPVQERTAVPTAAEQRPAPSSVRRRRRANSLPRSTRPPAIVRARRFVRTVGTAASWSDRPAGSAKAGPLWRSPSHAAGFEAPLHQIGSVDLMTEAGGLTANAEAPQQVPLRRSDGPCSRALSCPFTGNEFP